MVDSIALDISTVLEEFALYLKNKGKSKATVRYYSGDIRRILERDDVDQPSSFKELLSLLEKGINREEEKMNSNTLNRRIASLNKLNIFLREEYHIEDTHDYSNHFRKVPIRENLRVISEEEYSSLMNQIPREKLSGSRARALFSLIYGAGLTSGEVVRVNYYDFEREEELIKSIRVENRKGKERVLELDNSTQEELANYEKIAISREINIKSHFHPYFKIRGGQSLSSRSKSRIFEHWREKIGLDPDLNSTSLRLAYRKRLIEDRLYINEFAYRLGVTSSHARRLKSILSK